MAQILLSDFGDENVNGLYNEIGTHDGYPFYKKVTDDFIIIYKLENGPYSFSPAYWIEQKTNLWESINGAIPIFTPEYVNRSNDPFSGTWISLLGSTSGETIGILDEFSSSSSSRDSSSSSSSSSEDYSESSSSS